MSSPGQVSSLRTHLLGALSAIPGSRTFHLHVLVSTPRKPGQSLFLYADTRPKCFVQDVLVLLSEETTKHCPLSVDHRPPDASIELAPRIFVSAIEASVFAFPASRSSILYISKVDGTGQGAYPSPTSTLLRAFLMFYASTKSPLYALPVPPCHLWIHLFARSQRQYLFPNSADHPRKRPLGDVALCNWWKKMLSDVAKAVETTDDAVPASDARVVVPEATGPIIRLYYILPGQTELEASYLLRDAHGPSSSPQTPWIYSHPYNSEADIPFPSQNISTSNRERLNILPLAYLIPHFEDDPKSRFLDELAATSEEQAVAVPVPTPRRKRQKFSEGTDISHSTLGSEEIDAWIPKVGSHTTKDGNGTRADVETSERPLNQPHAAPSIMYIPPSSSPLQVGNLSPPLRPSTPEVPKNTMLSPHTPHLPTLRESFLSPRTPNATGSSPSVLTNSSSQASPRTPRTPRTPRRPKSDLDTVSPVEFWERMSFRQECALGAVTAFFVAVFSRPATPFQDGTLFTSSSTPTDGTTSSATVDMPSTLLSTGTIPHSVLKRVMSTLLTGVEFSTAERAQKGTQVIESAIKGLCQGFSQRDSSSGDPPKTANVIVDMTPDVYTSHVYTSLSTSNPPLVRDSADISGTRSIGVVNVLGVRRKKKRE